MATRWAADVFLNTAGTANAQGLRHQMTEDANR
jgi:hypothetical protein